MKYHYKAELLLLISSVIWGLSFPTVKIAMDYVSPHYYVFLRFLLTTCLFTIIFFSKILKMKLREIGYGMLLGIFLFLGFIFQTLGIKYTTASNSAFITGLAIVFLPFAQYFIIRNKPRIGNLAGIIVSIAGLYFLTNFESFSSINKGDVLTIFCAIAFTFQIIFLDVFSGKTSHLELLFGQFLAMTFLSFSSTLIFEIFIAYEIKFDLNISSLSSLIFNAVFSALIALFISNKFQKFTTPVRAGLIYNMEQVFAVIFSYFILNELLNEKQVIGAAIMLTGLLISEFSNSFKIIKNHDYI